LLAKISKLHVANFLGFKIVRPEGWHLRL